MNKSLILSRADDWRDKNPDIWRVWVAYAVNEAANKRRVSIRYLVEQTRKKDRVNRNGEPVKVNNTFSPIWARMLASEHPEIAPYIELRKSDWDDDFPIASAGM